MKTQPSANATGSRTPNATRARPAPSAKLVPADREDVHEREEQCSPDQCAIVADRALPGGGCESTEEQFLPDRRDDGRGDQVEDEADR